MKKTIRKIMGILMLLFVYLIIIVPIMCIEFGIVSTLTIWGLITFLGFCIACGIWLIIS